MYTEWTKKSWQNFNYYQKANWYDTKLLADVLQELSKLPALVFAGETRSLKKDLIDISRGDAFLLQCGDCSESFVDCQGPRIHNLIRIILQMSMIITYITNKRVVKIGRIAGQYAKPRSNEFEIVDNVQLPIYRGDMINSYLPTPEYRKHDPKRILEAYYKSAATLNLIRAFTKGGYASLQSITDWQKHYFKNFPIMDKYSEIVINITKAINFMKALGLDVNNPQFNEVNFYTSHEALILEYEESLTRIDTTTGDWYDTSAHMLWLGNRSRYCDSSQVEFLSGINNPIGIKVGPDYNDEDLMCIIDKLNPANEQGKICIITRFGIPTINKQLPVLIKHIKRKKNNVVWICDPVHGNTYVNKYNRKVRRFEDIVKEIESFWEICIHENVIPGGIHIELTGDNVTECIGGLRALSEEDLDNNYTSLCDPRLNAEQSVELAFKIADIVKQY